MAVKARPVACPPRHFAGSGRRPRSHRGKAPSIFRMNSRRPATLDGVPRPLPWARCAETLVRGGPEGGHRPHLCGRWRRAGNDPDAKPVCGTPRAERYAAAVVSFRQSLPNVAGRRSRHHGRERAPGAFRRGREASPPTFFSPIESFDDTALRKTNTPTNKTPQVAPGIRAQGKFNRLKSRMKKRAPHGYGVWRQYPSP